MCEKPLAPTVAECLRVIAAERTATERDLSKTLDERAQVAAEVSAGALALFERVSQHRKGLAMSEDLRQANAAGALACTRLGAQSSIPTHAELQTFLQKHP